MRTLTHFRLRYFKCWEEDFRGGGGRGGVGGIGGGGVKVEPAEVKWGIFTPFWCQLVLSCIAGEVIHQYEELTGAGFSAS